MHRRAGVALALAAGAFGFLPGALRHVLSAEHVHHAEPAGASLLGLLAIAGAAAVALALRRVPGRRIVVLALVAILTVLAFETALHSTHHLDEPDGGASCLVLSATAHVNGVSPPAVEVGIRPPVFTGLAGPSLAFLPPLRLLRASQQRAPPVSRSA